MCFSVNERSVRRDIGFRQCGQTNPPASAGVKLTSLSQDLHCRSIISDMKPLISALVIIDAAVSLQAQTGSSPLMDAARKERERRAQTKSSTVYTDANSHGLTVGNVTTATATAATEAAAAAAEASAKAAEAAPDPKAVREEEVRRLREKIQDLENQETALKLQINDFTNQVYAPVTTQDAKNDAQAKLGQSQAVLLDIQTELAHTRSDLQDLLNSPIGN